jgi:hypothetical protein
MDEDDGDGQRRALKPTAASGDHPAGGSDSDSVKAEEGEVMIYGGDQEELLRVLSKESDAATGSLQSMLALKDLRKGKDFRFSAERLQAQHRLRTLDLLECLVSQPLPCSSSPCFLSSGPSAILSPIPILVAYRSCRA